MTTKTPKPGETVQLSVAELQPNPWNPNVLPDEIMNALIENIRRHGFNQSITVRKTDAGEWQIVDGEHRWEAAVALDLDMIPCSVVEMDDSTAKAETLAMNRLRGEMEPVEVAKILRDIERDLPISELAQFTGYSSEELQGLRNLLDYDYSKLNEQGKDNGGEDDEERWVDLRYRVPESVAVIVRGEVDRLKKLRETQHEHLAVELMAVIVSQTSDAQIRGGEPADPDRT